MLIIILAIYTLNIGFKTQIPKVIKLHLILYYYVSGHITISVTVKVSYITYFDVWAFFCVLPIFFVIWEWTVLLIQKHNISNHTWLKVTELMESMGKGETKKKIQNISFFLVPTVYATFTIAYWIFVLVNIEV